MAKGICRGGAEQRAPYPIFACIVELFCLSGAVAAAASHRDVNKVTARQVFFFSLFVSLFPFFASADGLWRGERNTSGDCRGATLSCPRRA